MTIIIRYLNLYYYQRLPTYKNILKNSPIKHYTLTHIHTSLCSIQIIIHNMSYIIKMFNVKTISRMMFVSKLNVNENNEYLILSKYS